MNTNCPECARDAALGARFCRSCGNRLAPETEVTLDNTRRYSPEQQAAAEAARPLSAPESDPAAAMPPRAVFQPFTGQTAATDPMGAAQTTAGVDTARLQAQPAQPYMPAQPYPAGSYQASQYPPSQHAPSQHPFLAPPPMAPPAPVAYPKKSKKGIWIFLSLLLTVVIGVLGIVGAVVFFKARDIARRIQIETNQPSRVPKVPRPPGAPGQPPPRAPAGAPAENSVDLSLDDLEYPDAKIDKKITFGDQGLMIQTTGDEMDEVRDYYKDLFKRDPVVVGQDKLSVFKITGPPGILVALRNEGPRGINITITRLPVAFEGDDIPGLEGMPGGPDIPKIPGVTAPEQKAEPKKETAAPGKKAAAAPAKPAPPAQ
ncbi:MAG: hypothetical protein ACKV2V_18495 [Blastocatellia bacterium]